MCKQSPLREPRKNYYRFMDRIAFKSYRFQYIPSVLTTKQRISHKVAQWQQHALWGLVFHSVNDGLSVVTKHRGASQANIASTKR